MTITPTFDKKNKLVEVEHEGVQYICIPVTQIERVRQDYTATVEKSSETPIRTSFAQGYRFALERIGVNYFGELPEVPPYPHEFKERKRIKVGHNTYFEDEVIERLSALHTAESIWR